MKKYRFLYKLVSFRLISENNISCIRLLEAFVVNFNSDFVVHLKTLDL